MTFTWDIIVNNGNISISTQLLLKQNCSSASCNILPKVDKNTGNTEPVVICFRLSHV